MILDRKYIINLIFSIFLFFSSFSSNTSEKITIHGSTMGTTYSVTINEFISDENAFKQMIDDELNTINLIFSTYISDSELSKINNSKQNSHIVSDYFSYVLAKALYYCEYSKGTYDITINPLINLWGFSSYKEQKIPSEDDIKNILNNIGYNKVSLKNNILNKSTNIKMDLNSIAKGFAVDQIAELIEKNNYKDYLIEIGGELKSKKQDISTNWIVGIQSPISNTVIKKIQLNNMSMATSGTYNNFFEEDNQIYSHIINPMTGYPYKYKTISSTIVSKYCIDADAFATISMTMNPDEMISLINNETGVEGYILELKNNQLIEYKSNGFHHLEVEL